MKSAMIRKIVAILVSVTMVVGLTPIYAYADQTAGSSTQEATESPAPEEATPLVAGTFAESTPKEVEPLTMGASAGTTTFEVSSWQDLRIFVVATGMFSSNERVIKLKGDVICPEDQDRIPVSANVTIDLNGHTLNRNLSSLNDDGHVIEVLSGGYLTVTDSSAGKTGVITGGYSKRGGGVYVHEGGTLRIESGTITRNHASVDGGGIYVDGNLYMDGGAVSGNTAGEAGGGICAHRNTKENEERTLYITNSAVTYNESGSEGGGLYMDAQGAELTVTCTDINNNKSNDDGGGIYLQYGTITMSSSAAKATSVSNNIAKKGAGGIKVTGKTTLNATGVVISGNTAKDGDGGGVENNGRATLTSCTITGNTAKADGGGVSSYDDGFMTLKSCAITGNNATVDGGGVFTGKKLSIDGGVITQNIAGNGKGHGIFVGTKATLTTIEGSLVVQGNGTPGSRQDVYLRSGKVLSTKTLTTGARIGVTMENGTGVFTWGYKAFNRVGGNGVPKSTPISGGTGLPVATDPQVIDPNEYFFSLDGYDITQSDESNGEAQLTSAWQNLQAEITAKEVYGTVKLTRDYVAGPNDTYLKALKPVTIDLNGHTINRNLSSRQEDGHVIWVGLGTTLTIMDSSAKKTGTITGGYAAEGGGVYVRKGGTLNFEGGTICGNVGELSGGGVYVGGTLNMTGGTIADNNAGDPNMPVVVPNEGGGVYVNGTLNMTGGVITGNLAATGGGVSVSSEGSVNAKNAAIANNTAFWGTGGGMCLSPGKDATIENCTITGNTSKLPGGGLSMNAEGIKLTISDTHIDGNSSDADAGGIHLYYGTILMDGGSLASNTAPSGGGILVTSKTTFTATNAEISGNTADDEQGGGVKNLGSTTLKNCRVIGNNAEGEGGGVANGTDSNDEGILRLENCTISANASQSNGGGVYSNARIVIDGGTIGKSTARNGEEVPGNSAGGEESGQGGGVFIGEKAGITAIKGSISMNGNTAFCGEDLYLCSEKKLMLFDAITGTSIGKIGMQDIGVFTRNYSAFQRDADPSTFFATDEGAISVEWASDNKEVQLVSNWPDLQRQILRTKANGTVKLSQNYTAGSKDQRLQIRKSITIDLNGHTINRNLPSQKTDGNVIEVFSGATLTITDSSAANGQQGTGTIIGGFPKYGGGVYVNENATLNLNGGTIAGNRASGSGGGVYVAGKMTMSGGAIVGNVAGDSGGGIASVGLVEMAGGVIRENVADDKGGGIYADGNLTTQGGVIDGNTADARGGGVYVSAEGSIKMSDTTVTNNTAGRNGGGVHVRLTEDSHSYINNCLIAHNVTDEKGGGLYMDAKGEMLDIENTRIESNSSGGDGGGLYLCEGTVRMYGGSLSDNVSEQDGGGAKLTNGTTFGANRVDIRGNQAASEQGGGVKNYGTTHLIRCNIVENSAIKDGGGVYNGSGLLEGSLTLEHCTVSGNTTQHNGGGVWSDAPLSIVEGGTITGNTADNGGGGVFIGKSTMPITTSIEGELVVTDNEAGLFGDNAFLRSGQVLTLSKALTDNAKIGVDLENGSGTITKNYSQYHNSDDPERLFTIAKGYSLEVTNGEATIHSHWKELQREIYIKAKANGGEIELDRDYTASASDTMLEIPAGKSITIDLHGHAINRNRMGMALTERANIEASLIPPTSGVDEDGHVFEVAGTLTLQDSSQGRTGTVMGGWAINGGGIYVNEGATLNLEGGAIARNKADISGAGVYVQGTLNMTGGVVEGNETMNWRSAFAEVSCGGGILVDEKGTLNLEGGTITGNRAYVNGGGIKVAKGAKANVQGSPVVKGNEASVGDDVYLPFSSKLTVTGALTEDAHVGIAMENDWGTVTSGYGTYNDGADPARRFVSTEGYAVFEKNNEVELGLNTYGETDDAHPFIDRNNQVDTNTDALTGQNWMAGISGERYLNEINMPGSHDAGMKSVEVLPWGKDHTAAVTCFAPSIGGKYAKTQTKYIDEQMAEGARQLDIRLNNRYKAYDKTEFGYNWKDDGRNLWLCHGTNELVGTFMAQNPNGKDLSFDEVLGWVKDFLRKHPTETIVLNIRPETTDSGANSTIYKRACEILGKLALETNPSTGEPYLYKESDAASYFERYTHMPQLKDCRGKIVLLTKGAGFADVVGGFEADSFVEYVAPTSYELTSTEKVAEMEREYTNLNGDGRVVLPTDADANYNFLWYWEMNCTGEDQGALNQYVLGGATPVGIASVVNPGIIGDDKLFGPDKAGQYIGWVRLDAFEAKYAEPIWRTNFSNRLQYCTVTVESGLGDPYVTQTYQVLKGTMIEVPANIYKNLPEGKYLGSWKATGASTDATCNPGETFRVDEDVTFTAQWLQPGERPVRIIWKDGDNADKLRTHSVNLTVTSSNGETSQMTLTDEQRWSSVLASDVTSVVPDWDLIVPTTSSPFGQDAEGQYRYEANTEPGNGYTFTFYHTPQRWVAASGAIAWDDDDNADGLRPASVRLRLNANGTVLRTAEITAESGWKFDFGEFAMYEKGKKVEYSITEGEIEGYSTLIDGFTVTNTHASSARSTMSIIGYMEWRDGKNAQGLRPESVTVHLKANGEEVASQKIASDQSNSAMFDFGEFAVNDSGGQPISYSVVVEDIPEYTTTVSMQGSNVFRITNTLVVQEEEKRPVEIDEHPKPHELTYNGKPQALVAEGDASGGTMLYALGVDATHAPSKAAYSTALPTGTDVGAYFIWYYVEGDESHVDSEAACAQASIAKADQTIKAKDVECTVGEVGKAVAATAMGVGGAADGVGALSYAVTDGDGVVGVDASTGALTPRAKGTATVTVTAAATRNYNAATKDVAITVLPVMHTVTFYEDTAGTQVWHKETLEEGAPLAGLANYGNEEGHILAKSGYTFAGWVTAPNIVVNSYRDTSGNLNTALDGKLVEWNASITQDMNAYPIWIRDRLEVKLITGGDDKSPVTMGTGYDNKPQSTDFAVDIDEILHMKGLNDATRNGYELVGWYTQDGVKWPTDDSWGVTPEYCEKNADGTPIVQTNEERKFNYYTVKLTAHWTPKSANVTYALGDHAAVDAVVPTHGPVNLEDSFTLAAAPAAEEGYVFSGWQDTREGGKLYSAGGTYSFDSWDMATSGTITLTAQWVQTKAVTLTFDAAGGMAVEPVTDDSSVTVDLSDAKYITTRAGYTFDGWYEGGTKREGSYTVTANTTLTAHWKATKYKITFDSAGGSSIAAIEQDYDTTITAPQAPVKDHYDFQGWMPALPAKMPAKDMTVRAIWAPTNCTLNFNTAGGSDVASITDIYGAKVEAPQDPIKNGYVFAGWLNAEGQAVTFPLYMPAGETTLTAKWKVIPEAPNVALEARDAHTVGVANVVRGAEYIIVPAGQEPTDQDWASAKTPEGKPLAVTFGDLAPATSYDVWGRMVETDDAVASEAAKATVTTPKEPQDAIPAPAARAINASTVVVIKPSEAQEYALVAMGMSAPTDDEEWSSPDVGGEEEWTGLAPSTEYDVYTRMKATATKDASPVSEPTTVMTAAASASGQDTYTVTWKDADGTILEIDSGMSYGAMPSYVGETPEKERVGKLAYRFAGWDPAIAKVTGDATYMAKYEEYIVTHTISFVNEDGTLLQTGKVEDGDIPSFKGDVPKKAADAQYAYTFKGWNPEIVAAIADATYTATYVATPVDSPVKKGSITFDFGGGTLDGKTSLTIVADVGDVITIPGAPTKDGYEFKYWKGSEYYPGDKYTVEGDHAFTAVWEQKTAESTDAGDKEKAADEGKDAATKGVSATQSSTKSTVAKTGDSLSVTILLMLVALADAALIVTILARARRHGRNRHQSLHHPDGRR